VDDLLAARAYLAERFPDRPLFVVGISLGAAVSLQALPHLPEVRGVWSEGAFARLGTPVENLFRPLPCWVRGPLLAIYYRLGQLDCGLWVPAVNPIDAVTGASVPVHFCHGRQDELVPFSEAEALDQAYPGPKAHWWVENAGHDNVRQRNANEYRVRLRSFLAALLTFPDSSRMQPAQGR
jgi:fermentation-respiration switch protein FrsA (DUF1100 family)